MLQRFVKLPLSMIGTTKLKMSKTAAVTLRKVNKDLLILRAGLFKKLLRHIVLSHP